MPELYLKCPKKIKGKTQCLTSLTKISEFCLFTNISCFEKKYISFIQLILVIYHICSINKLQYMLVGMTKNN